MLATTQPLPPPLVPEFTVRTAQEVLPLWEQALRELATGEEPPFWAFPWAGGQAVARYLLDHPALVRGRTVLDLGCGAGLVALAAGRSDAAAVAAVDIDPLALAATALNAAANGVGVSTHCLDLLAPPLRGADEVAAAVGLAVLDVVAVGDLFYTRELTETLLPVLHRLAADGCEVLVGDPRRRFLPASGLDLLAEYDVPVSRDLEGMTTRRTAVFRLPPPA